MFKDQELVDWLSPIDEYSGDGHPRQQQLLRAILGCADEGGCG
jgi:hypothetical protein